MILIRHENGSLAQYRTDPGERIVAIEVGQHVIDWAVDSQSAPVSAESVILQDNDGQSDRPDDDPGAWLSSWSQSGWERFDAGYRAAVTKAELANSCLVLRPSANGMLSDAVCTLNWCTRGGGQEARILLDPMGWIVPTMLRDLEDHLDRIMELCLELHAHGCVWGVLLRSIRSNGDPALLEPCTLEEGEIPSGMLTAKFQALLEVCDRQVLMGHGDLAFTGRDSMGSS